MKRIKRLCSQILTQSKSKWKQEKKKGKMSHINISLTISNMNGLNKLLKGKD